MASPETARLSKKTKSANCRLATKSETLNERTVTRNVNVGEVTEETAALADEEEKSATRVVVVLVLLEVLGQILDARGEQCNLNLRGSSVTGVRCVFFDDRLLDVCFESHVVIPFLVSSLRGASCLVQ
jgi:hypothetical protein